MALPPTKQKKPLHIRFLLILSLLLLLLAFFIVLPFLQAILGGVILAYLFYPVYTWVDARVKQRSVSALLVSCLVLLFIIVPAFFLLRGLAKQAHMLFELGKGFFDMSLLEKCTSEFCGSVRLFLEQTWVQQAAHDSLQTASAWIVEKASEALISIPKLLLSMFVLFFVFYYLLRDGDMFVAKAEEFMRIKKEHHERIVKRVQEVTNAVVFGYIVTALLQGIAGMIIFALFGIPSPVFWGVVMAFFAIIPYLGTGVVWAPASLILVFQGIVMQNNLLLLKGIGLFAVCFVFVSGLDNVLRPRLIGKKAKVHPVLIFLGILGGVFLMGPVGIVLGPVILEATTTVLKIYLGEVEKGED